MIKTRPLFWWYKNNLLPRVVTLASKSSVADVKPLEVDDGKPIAEPSPRKPAASKLVAQAFASLKDAPASPSKSPKKQNFNIDSLINEAKDVESLLRVAAIPNISRKHALKVLTTLGEYKHEGIINREDLLRARERGTWVGDFSLYNRRFSILVHNAVYYANLAWLPLALKAHVLCVYFLYG